MNTKACEKGVDPRWVQSLLHAFRNKDQLVHSSSCNQSSKFFPSFCINCLELHCKICHRGADNPHKEHLVLPSYKASNEDCFRANQVSRLIDISDIHPFLINHSQIVIVNRRRCEQPKSRTNKFAYKCETCGREFQKDKRFCSIECKNDSGEDLSLRQKPEAPPIHAQSYRIKKRKGIPRRAPFF